MKLKGLLIVLLTCATLLLGHGCTGGNVTNPHEDEQQQGPRNPGQQQD